MTSGTQILAACGPGEMRAVAIRDGQLLDYAIHRPGAPDGIGDRIRGRVIAAVPAMAGAFVALPDGEGFLPDSQGAAGLSTGDCVTVLVTRAAQGGKGPRLSARTEQSPPGPPAVLETGPDAIERLLGLHPSAAIVVDDPAIAIGRAATVVPRAWPDDVCSAIEALSETDVPLPHGARATIHPTPALTAIDLDTASATADRRGKAAAQRAANEAAFPALAGAIRLRNLSGAIVLDLAGMAPKARSALAPALHTALSNDPLQPRFLGFTALGLAEIIRPRVHPPLHELLAGPHAAGLAALRGLEAALAAEPGLPRRLRAHPTVVRSLEADRFARSDFTRRTGRALVLVSDPALPPGSCMMEAIPRA